MSVLRHALVLSVLVTVAAPATVTAAPVPGVVARKAPATPMVSMYKSPKGMTNNACTNLLADAQALKSIRPASGSY